MGQVGKDGLVKMPKGEKSKLIEMRGKRFGRLLVLEPMIIRAKDGSVNVASWEYC